MDEMNRKAGKDKLRELMTQVPNFVDRIKVGKDLRSMTISGVQASAGINAKEAEYLVNEFLEEMTSGKLGPE